MNPVLAGFAWVGGIWMAIAVVAAWTVHRRRPQLPQRTRADVYRDVDIQRAVRQFAQAIDDHDEVWAIWPDPPSARLIELQHRLDRSRKENQ